MYYYENKAKLKFFKIIILNILHLKQFSAHKDTYQKCNLVKMKFKVTSDIEVKTNLTKEHGFNLSVLNLLKNV